MKLFYIPEEKEIAKKISKETGIKLGAADVSQFESGDYFVKIKTSVRNKKCYLLGGTRNASLTKTLLLSHTLKKSGAKEVIALIPYLAYARQDKVVEGESIGVQVLGEMFLSCGITRAVVIDVHSKKDADLFPIPLISLDPYKVLVKAIRSEKLNNPALVAPDEGAADNLCDLRKAYGKDSIDGTIYFHKHRNGRKIKFLNTEIIKAEEYIIVDDILDTGNTLAAIARKLHKNDPENIIVIATHSLFSGSDWKKMWDFGVKKIFTTDSTGVKINDKRIIYIPTYHIFADFLNKQLKK